MGLAQFSATVNFQIEESECIFRLHDDAGRTVRYGSWTTFEDESNFVALAILAGFLQSELAHVTANGEGVSLSAASIAKLDDDTSTSLGLPGPVGYLLQIDARGRLGNLRLDTRWVDSNGLRVRNASSRGPMLLVGDASFRLVSPIYEILQQIEAFNSRGDGSPATQARDWAEIQELIGGKPAHIHPSQFLERMRVARANRFSLDFVAGEDGGFQVAPVPLTRACWLA